MWFVYIHIVWFASWIGFGVEGYPYGLLTMIVSLEAIFLSTFVMISQNRADAKRQVVADQQWQTVKEEDKQNQELLNLSNQILELTKAIHDSTSSPSCWGLSRVGPPPGQRFGCPEKSMPSIPAIPYRPSPESSYATATVRT
jgi:Protein of unknown function (DUF1003)